MVAAVAPPREVRLALVLNGGVSLAVWIGGVVREIDAARRGSAHGADDTAPVYAAVNAALGQTATVDVVGGASAGGINGVLLGAAIFNGRALDDLRETWISIGDFRTLLRSQGESNPPSLMRGDAVVLPELERVLAGLWAEHPQPANERLYVYVTATDLFGYAATFEDTGGRRFQETDHRRVFRFEHEQGRDAGRDDTGPAGALRDLVPLAGADARGLLAHAARASSSFPVAFEAHGFPVRDPDGRTPEHWLVDGGILDNQPFNPVLDRIAVLPADRPTKRVVVYVVPYVTDVGTPIDAHAAATAKDTLSAANALPRDLPKLQGLERITREVRRQRSAMRERAQTLDELDDDRLATSASALFGAYVLTRLNASRAVFALWAQPDFRPGNGTIAQHPAQEPADLLPLVPPWTGPVPDLPWLPASRSWSREDETWRWGLSPAERVAAWALVALRPLRGTTHTDLEGRSRASALVDYVRETKLELRRAFTAIAAGGTADVVALAADAYGRVGDRLAEIQRRFVELDSYLGQPAEPRPRPVRVQTLLDLEVVRNATAVHEESVSFPFHFLLASAGVESSLGHPDAANESARPADKLAGMKLGHFGGFLKRSWRANDWLWGRLDGVEHLMRALVDAERLVELEELGALPDAAARLEQAALGASDDERELLTRLWTDDLVRSGFAAGESLPQIVGRAADESDPRRAEALACLRRALARPAQLRILRADLGRIAETARDDVASGSSPVADGALWANRVPAGGQGLAAESLVSLFRSMRVGSEPLAEEAGSRLVLDVGAQTAAVAAAVFAGDRGGLPAPARAALASTRAVTLSTSRLVQLVAREPWVGAAAVAVLVGLLVWAGISNSTLVGTIFPGLALTVAVLALSLLTIATSAFELAWRTPARLVASVVFALVPAAFAVVALVVRQWHALPAATAWLDLHVGHRATLTVASLAAVGAVAAAALAFSPRTWVRLRFWLLTAYRLAVALAVAGAAAGVVLQRWRRPPAVVGQPSRWADVAHEHRGAILVLVLLVVVAAAGVVEILLARIRAAPPPRAGAAVAATEPEPAPEPGRAAPTPSA